MAPFPIVDSQPQNEPRHASPDQITLSITHASTTYTTVIPLGAATAIASNAAASTFLTTPVGPARTETGQVTFPRASSSSGSSNTGVVIGAVLGSILGTLVLITIFYKCCIDNRSAAWIPTLTSYDSDCSDSERSSRSDRRVHRRGGGGLGFGRDNRQGDRVRRPRRAKTRRSRREESGSRSSRSYSARYNKRRRRGSGMSNNHGLLGWSLVPRTTRYGYQYSERKHARNSWAGGGGRSSADD